MMHTFENKAVIPRILDRTALSRDKWRHYVTEQLKAAPNVDMVQLPSGAWRITRGNNHITTCDLSGMRSAELEQFLG